MDGSAITFYHFFGLKVSVRCEEEEVAQDVHRDFSYFRASSAGLEAPAGLRIDVVCDPFPRERLPMLPAAVHTPRNVVYRQGNVSYIDYFGRALSVCDAAARTCVIHCADRDLAHEIAYLTVLWRVGEHLDAIGLHRVHALGLEAGGRAVVVLLPMAGGKTTLALKMMESDEARLLSEDSPLIGRGGLVTPFPLRIGVRAGREPKGIPQDFRRTVDRMEHGPKTLIDIEYFREKIAGACPPGAILLGEKWLAGPSFIRPAPRREAVGAMVRNSVVGLGLYQGMEFVLERSAWEVIGKAGLAVRRLRNCLQLIRRSEVYRLAMGPDPEECARTLRDFLREFASRRRRDVDGD